jgi:hypothetical protein
MAKAPKRETENVSQEAPTFVEVANPVLEKVRLVVNRCGDCSAWRPEAAIPFGGCAKSGLTTTHYGETRYVHYTPDGASCSAFEAKE